MKFLIGILVTVSLIGVIGLVDNAEAESYQEVDLGLILSTCNTKPIELTSKFIHLTNHTDIYISNLNSHSFLRNHYEGKETEGLKNIQTERPNQHWRDSERIIIIISEEAVYWDIGYYHNDSNYRHSYCERTYYDKFGNLGNQTKEHYEYYGDYEISGLLKPITWNLSDEPQIQKRNKINDEYIINLIAKTFNLTPDNQPDRTETVSNEQIQKLKDKNKELKNKHQACNNDKDRVVSELSELQSRFTILETNSNQTQSQLNEALFTIEKLTTQLNEAKKKIEELESP